MERDQMLAACSRAHRDSGSGPRHRWHPQDVSCQTPFLETNALGLSKRGSGCGARRLRDAVLQRVHDPPQPTRGWRSEMRHRRRVGEANHERQASETGSDVAGGGTFGRALRQRECTFRAQMG